MDYIRLKDSSCLGKTLKIPTAFQLVSNSYSKLNNDKRLRLKWHNSQMAQK